VVFSHLPPPTFFFSLLNQLIERSLIFFRIPRHARLPQESPFAVAHARLSEGRISSFRRACDVRSEPLHDGPPRSTFFLIHSRLRWKYSVPFSFLDLTSFRFVRGVGILTGRTHPRNFLPLVRREGCCASFSLRTLPFLRSSSRNPVLLLLWVSLLIFCSIPPAVLLAFFRSHPFSSPLF